MLPPARRLLTACLALHQAPQLNLQRTRAVAAARSVRYEFNHFCCRRGAARHSSSSGWCIMPRATSTCRATAMQGSNALDVVRCLLLLTAFLALHQALQLNLQRSSAQAVLWSVRTINCCCCCHGGECATAQAQPGASSASGASAAQRALCTSRSW
jgi:hypothetical protein